jgi:hypothetical protein
MRWWWKMSKVLCLSPPDSEARQLVFRVVPHEADLSLSHRKWTRRILELADGRPLEEISKVMYEELLKAGGWISDIGVLSSSFHFQVSKAVYLLAEQGYVRIATQRRSLPDP